MNFDQAGSVDGSDIKRWARTLRESELSYKDQLIQHNTLVGLVGFLQKLNVSYTDKCARLELLGSSFDILHNMGIAYRRGGPFPVEAAVIVIESIVDDVEDLNEKEKRELAALEEV